LKNLLDYLEIEKVVIFGVSWGGVLAQRFAITFPETCSAIVLDSTSSEVNLKASENWYKRGEIARLGVDRALAGRELSQAFDGHKTASSHTYSRVLPEHVNSYVAQCRATGGLREHPLTPDLESLNVPTLVVGAGKDTVAGAGGSVILDRTLPKSELHIFPDAGHGVYATEREGFRKLLLDFLGRLNLI
jgi:pimeloyl-ACP methyl ester carboxylesterase